VGKTTTSGHSGKEALIKKKLEGAFRGKCRGIEKAKTDLSQPFELLLQLPVKMQDAFTDKYAVQREHEETSTLSGTLSDDQKHPAF